MTTAHTARIAQIHASSTRAMFVVTGGGTQAVADLLAVPGASRTVLEALVTYSEASLHEFLGMIPDQAVSVETAALLAKAAYQRALQLDEGANSLVGVSCTAALVTDRPKKGDHRAHVGMSSVEGTRVYSLTLTKGARDRDGEERVVSDLLIDALAHVAGLQATRDDMGLLADECVLEQAVVTPPS